MKRKQVGSFVPEAKRNVQQRRSEEDKHSIPAVAEQRRNAQQQPSTETSSTIVLIIPVIIPPEEKQPDYQSMELEEILLAIPSIPLEDFKTAVPIPIINDVESRGFLCKAVQGNRLDIVKYLIDPAVINLAEKDSAGNIPIIEAANSGNTEILRLLLSQVDENYESDYADAINVDLEDDISEAIQSALMREDKETAKLLLKFSDVHHIQTVLLEKQQESGLDPAILLKVWPLFCELLIKKIDDADDELERKLVPTAPGLASSSSSTSTDVSTQLSSSSASVFRRSPSPQSPSMRLETNISSSASGSSFSNKNSFGSGC